jgi:hypothetical protein
MCNKCFLTLHVILKSTKKKIMKLITLILFSIFYTSSCAQIIDYSH